MYDQDVRKLAGNKNLDQKTGHSYPIIQRESLVFNYRWLSLLLWLACQTGFGQILPKYNPLFNDGAVPSIYITMDADSLNDLLLPSNWEEDHEYPATFIWDNGSKKDTVQNIGFRLRGNTSRFSAKKSFKIKFTHFGSNKFYGLSDMNLNGEHNDPSLSRAKIVWDLMRKAGIMAPRANHVRLYINNEYMGIYLNVEHIDNDFFQARGKSGDGQIFKCLYGSDFVYRGANPASYPPTVYEPQNHKDEPNFYDLIEFIRVLSLKDNTDYRCLLENKWEVDDYLKTLAMEVLVGHWDNPVYNKNNAYLYIADDDDRVSILSYDTDNTMGIDWLGEDWATKNIYSWAEPKDQRPLFYNPMTVAAYKNRYGYHIKTWLETFMKADSLQKMIYSIRDRIKPYRVNDRYSELDYGFDFDDFMASFDQMNDRHVKYGIRDYFTKRLSTAKSQLQNTTVHPFFGNRTASYFNGKFHLSFMAEAMKPLEVSLEYRFENNNWERIALSDDGTGWDKVKGDHQYHFIWQGTEPGNFYYRIKGIDADGKESTWPVCESFAYAVGYNEVPLLKINEWMADNTDIKDEVGEAEDWIEIYNAGTEDIYLGQYYLSDNPDKPNKWRMPDLTLPAFSWIRFWADEDGQQGDHHANFKLSKQGEFIGIYDNADNLYAPIDTLRFGFCATNSAYGRFPDGGVWWGELSLPSPGSSNVLTGIGDVPVGVRLYPNPSTHSLHIQLEAGWKVQDIMAIDSHKVNADVIPTAIGLQLDTRHLAPGMYFIRLQSPTGSQHTASWIKQ